MTDTCWRDDLAEAMQNAGDAGPVLCCTLSEEQMAVTFDHGFGGVCGAPFTVWTESRVYFPCCYDGSEWVASVPRNPSGEATKHVGGG